MRQNNNVLYLFCNCFVIVLELFWDPLGPQEGPRGSPGASWGSQGAHGSPRPGWLLASAREGAVWLLLASTYDKRQDVVRQPQSMRPGQRTAWEKRAGDW